jgi:hypothetical protein
MALAGLRHGAVPYFRLVHPKVVPFRFNTAPNDLCSQAGIVLPGFVCTASAAESFSDLGLALRMGIYHHILVCNDVLQHLHPLRREKTAKIELRPQARHWRSHKTVAEVDRSSAIVENHS